MVVAIFTHYKSPKKKSSMGVFFLNKRVTNDEKCLVFFVGKHVRVLMLGSGYNQTLRKGIPMSLNGFIDYSLRVGKYHSNGFTSWVL